jgi:probable rRNA maturation factor
LNQVEVSSAGLEPPPWAARLARFARRVLRARGIRDWDLSLLLCDDPTIRELNRRYRGLDAATDVLSFPQHDDTIPSGGGGAPVDAPEAAQRSAGDVVISVDSMRRNAAGGGVPEEEELKRLIIHGILHLEGMDHPDEDSEMLALQERILSLLAKERVL